MNAKERLQVQSSMKDIKQFFMKLTDDPKLKLKCGDDGMR